MADRNRTFAICNLLSAICYFCSNVGASCLIFFTCSECAYSTRRSKRRLLRFALRRRRCDLPICVRMTLPVAVILNRFAVALCVFILGTSLSKCHSEERSNEESCYWNMTLRVLTRCFAEFTVSEANLLSMTTFFRSSSASETKANLSKQGRGLIPRPFHLTLQPVGLVLLLAPQPRQAEERRRVSLSLLAPALPLRRPS